MDGLLLVLMLGGIMALAYEGSVNVKLDMDANPA